jgi:NADPH:quinone reductase
MKAVLCQIFAGPERLIIAELAEPEPRPGEVSVAVRFAGLNFFDTLIIEGKYQIQPLLPFSPAAEFCGTVHRCGSGVDRFKPGDRVAGFIEYGACRELVICRVDQLTALPPGLDDPIAAGLAVTYGTSLHALRQRADLRAGETLAVLGAAGGAGIAAVEIGQMIGARVIACASSREKIAFAQAFGATDGVDYSVANLKTELRRLTNGEGVNVVYDPVGGALSEAALRALAWQGRFLVIGFASGEIPKIPLNLTLLRGCDVRGVFWGEFVRRDRKTHQDNMSQLVDWAAKGRIQPHIHAIYSPEQISAALQELKDRKARGKILIRF